MGLIEACRGRQVYLDTNIFIYAVEGLSEHEPVLRPLFELLASGGASAVTSELTLAEVLPRPLAVGRADIAAAYERMLAVAGPENRRAMRLSSMLWDRLGSASSSQTFTLRG